MAWTDISNAAVAAGAALTTGLMTALRDNFGGLAARDTGAPKILGNPYDYQEFLTSGTWTKPESAESGDVVLVQVVGGGGAGGRGPATGGGGGGGAFQRFDDIDLLGATEDVVVGAGGAGRSSNGSGASGGDSTFGTVNTESYLKAEGGGGGILSAIPTIGGRGGGVVRYGSFIRIDKALGSQGQFGGAGGRIDSSNDKYTGESSITGGGGGGTLGDNGGPSMYAGGGGHSSSGSTGQTDGLFPGGGGGSSDGGTTGAGGDGVVRVWCIKEQS